MSILISPARVEACKRFGEGVVASYGRGAKPRSRGLAINGIDKDSHAQAVGRAGEVGLCLFLSLNPETALNWGTSRTDDGHDLRIGGIGTIDVKASDHPRARSLIWPVTKTHFFAQGAADILVLAVVAKTLASVDLRGWALKDDFMAWKRIAAPGEAMMQGTWYVDQDRLMSMHVLRQWVANTVAA